MCVLSCCRLSFCFTLWFCDGFFGGESDGGGGEGGKGSMQALESGRTDCS